MNKKMRELRGKKSQSEVANDLGIAQTTLSSYENGVRTPRDGVKKKIADYYGVSVQELFFSV